jgi:autotransporter-associated beta strand protein
MKSKKALHHFLCIAGSSLLAVSHAHAQDQDGTWTKNATGTQNWSDPLNWSAGNVADGIGFSAYLSDVINANRTITLDTARTIGNIYAQDTTHDYTISGANTLTLDASSGQSILDVVSGRTLNIGTAVTVNDGIEKTGAGAVSITGAVSLGASQTWTNNSAGAFTTSNTNLLNNNGHSLTFEGSGTFNIGTITNKTTAVLTGTGNLIKNDSGRVNIGGLNSGFSGTVTVNGGVLHMTDNAGGLGIGNVTLNGGVLSHYWTVSYSRTLGTGDNQVQILGGESGFGGSSTSGPTVNLGTSVTWGSTYFQPSKFVLGDANTGNAGVITFSSNIDLNSGTRTILVPAGASTGGNRSTISGRIFGTGNLVKEGGGYLLLTHGYATTNLGWSGTTTVSAGTLDFTNANMANIGGGSGRNITVAAGAAVRFNTLSNAILNRIVETNDEITVMTGATNNNLDFSSSTGANLPNAFLGNWAGNNAKAEYSGTITPGSNGYKLGGRLSNGNLGIRSTLTGNNTLTVGQTGGSGVRVTLAADNTHTGETVINAGAKLNLGRNLALQNSALNVGAAGGNIAFNGGTEAATITGNEIVSSPTFGGLIGSRNLSSVFTNVNSNNESNLGANLITGFTLNVADGNTFSYSGAIGGFGTGTTNNNGGGTGGNSTLTKTGAGTQILDGTSTYTGGTFINGGKLALGALGTIDNTSAVVLGGGTFDISAKVGGYAVNNLAGSGAVIGSLTVSTALSIGASTGTINFENLTMGALSTFAYEVTGGDTNADLANVSGTLTLTAGTVLDLVQIGTFTVGDKFTLFGYTTGNLVGTFAGLGDGAEFTAGGGDWKILYEDTSAGLNGGTGTSFVTVTAIPEPGAALLGGLGLLALLRRRR